MFTKHTSFICNYEYLIANQPINQLKRKSLLLSLLYYCFGPKGLQKFPDLVWKNLFKSPAFIALVFSMIFFISPTLIRIPAQPFSPTLFSNCQNSTNLLLFLFYHLCFNMSPNCICSFLRGKNGKKIK